MARSFIRKIKDNFQYDKRRYNEFVQKYGFTLPKYLFINQYLKIFFNSDNDDIGFERLSRLKNFSDDEIEKFLKLIEIHNILVNSPNYRWIINDKYYYTFIADYFENFDLINIIIELDLIDLYIKFKDVFSYKEFLDFSKKFDNDKSILDKLSIQDVKNKNFLNLVELYKKKLPNEKEIIELYNTNYTFRLIYNNYSNDSSNERLLFIVLENYHDLNNVDKLYNCIRILENFPKLYNTMKEIMPDLELVIKKMLVDEDFYQTMLLLITQTNLENVLESSELSKKIFKNKDQFFDFITLQLDSCNTLADLKNLFRKTFPECSILVNFNSGIIDDDDVKICYDICNIVEESTDLNVLKEKLLEFYQNFDIYKCREKVIKFLVKSELDGLFDKVIDEKKMMDLPKENKTIGNNKILVYHLEDIPFEAIIHVISRENKNLNKILDLKNHPENWGTKGEGSTLLSLSMVGNKHEDIFGGTLSKSDLDTLIIGFGPIALEQVSSLSSHDSASRTDNANFKNNLGSIVKRSEDFKYLMNFNVGYNEIAVSRFLPSGDSRKPIYILIGEEDIDNLTPTSPQVLWATYFNIPIIAVNYKKYKNNVIGVFCTMLKEVSNLPDDEKLAKLPELMANYPYMYWGSKLDFNNSILALKLFHILKLYSENRNEETTISIRNIRIPSPDRKSVNIFDFIESGLTKTSSLYSADINNEIINARYKLHSIKELFMYDIAHLASKNDIDSKKL